MILSFDKKGDTKKKKKKRRRANFAERGEKLVKISEIVLRKIVVKVDNKTLLLHRGIYMIQPIDRNVK